MSYGTSCNSQCVPWPSKCEPCQSKCEPCQSKCEPCHNKCESCCSCHNSQPTPRIEENIAIDYVFNQAQLGNYFIGQTPLFNSTSNNALVALVNPTNSNSIVYVNIETISNASNALVTAYFYIGGALPATGFFLNSFPSTNTAIIPRPIANAQIQYIINSSYTPLVASQFMRLVPTGQTLVDDIGGRIILAPGESLIVLLEGLNGNASVVFGWWEKPIHHRC